ncbi:MAG: preprotein translocase subunit SecG [Alphaproteobacteria bacterium]|nr:preprotein translocase subunit SecG [Alphaproteobacteria bacterium]
MDTVLLVAHLILAVALISVILIQRTAQDGGGLMGGGSTMGGLFTARGSANLLTRTTAILATLFICTSMTLGFIASAKHKTRSVTDQIAPISAPAAESEAAKDKPETAPSVPVSK